MVLLWVCYDLIIAAAAVIKTKCSFQWLIWDRMVGGKLVGNGSTLQKLASVLSRM